MFGTSLNECSEHWDAVSSSSFRLVRLREHPKMKYMSLFYFSFQAPKKNGKELEVNFSTDGTSHIVLEPWIGNMMQ